MRSRNMTSVIDDIENVSGSGKIFSGPWWGWFSGGLSRFVEEIHEFHCLGFHGVHDSVDSRDEEIVGEEGGDADDETGHGSHQSLVDAR